MQPLHLLFARPLISRSARNSSRPLLQVLNKSMDTTTPNAEKMEFYVLSRPDSRLSHHYLNTEEVDALLKSVADDEAAAGDM